MKDCNCIFCKIANGEIPSDTIYEDDDFRAILDLSPAAQGHALLLPKEHFANLFELDDATGAKVMPVAKRIGGAMMRALSCRGLNVVQNNGEAAGQTVMHFHVHLIPRYEGGEEMVAWTPHKSDPREQQLIAERIRKEL